VLFPERNAWCAFWRNRAGGTNGGGIYTRTQRRGGRKDVYENRMDRLTLCMWLGDGMVQ